MCYCVCLVLYMCSYVIVCVRCPPHRLADFLANISKCTLFECEDIGFKFVKCNVDRFNIAAEYTKIFAVNSR